MTDTDLQAELVAHAQGRTPILDRVFPPPQCDDTWAARYYDNIDRRRT